MDHYISMFIDDELSLDEKILFVEHVHSSESYTNDAVILLRQEKELQGLLIKEAPEISIPTVPSKIFSFFGRTIILAAAACILVVFSFFIGKEFKPQTQTHFAVQPPVAHHRFLIHHQDTSLVEITGSFTNWQRLPLSPTGTEGYWEIYLDLPVGEHRYSFIIDGTQYLPDPTIPARESDDFGSTNSILKIKA